MLKPSWTGEGNTNKSIKIYRNIFFAIGDIITDQIRFKVRKIPVLSN